MSDLPELDRSVMNAMREGAQKLAALLEPHIRAIGAEMDKLRPLVDAAIGLDRAKPGGDTTAFLDIVFDGPPSHQSGRFVEVEDASGRSVHAGEWIDRGDGMWALRIGDRVSTREREAFLAGLSCGESGDVAKYSSWDEAADVFVRRGEQPEPEKPPEVPSSPMTIEELNAATTSSLFVDGLTRAPKLEKLLETSMKDDLKIPPARAVGPVPDQWPRLPKQGPSGTWMQETAGRFVACNSRLAIAVNDAVDLMKLKCASERQSFSEVDEIQARILIESLLEVIWR